MRTRNDTVEVAEKLERSGYPALALNGDMNQAQRERAVDQIKTGKANILIATDVVARGLDIPRISTVINYDLPGDNESYVHRIGRTGRAGRSGTAISFVRPREMYLLRQYERLTSGQISPFELPSIQEIGQARIAKTQAQLASLIAEHDLTEMKEIVESMAEQAELSMTDLAAALLHLKQVKQPLRPKEDPRPRRESRDRDQRRGRDGRDDRRASRNDRNDRPRKSKVARQDVDWQTYRIEVGTEHGAKPGDIVGAIANEISLDSGYIGQIKLQDRFSFVQLPKGMPDNVFKQLKRVRVRRQALEISVSQAPVVTENTRKRNDKGRRGVKLN